MIKFRLLVVLAGVVLSGGASAFSLLVSNYIKLGGYQPPIQASYTQGEQTCSVKIVYGATQFLSNYTSAKSCNLATGFPFKFKIVVPQQSACLKPLEFSFDGISGKDSVELVINNQTVASPKFGEGGIIKCDLPQSLTYQCSGAGCSAFMAAQQ